MTLQEFRDKLSWLRENGANVNRTICKTWILEYLSDKNEIPRSMFNEIKKYADIVCYKNFSIEAGMEFRDKIPDWFLICFEDEINKETFFQYQLEKSTRKIKVVD